MGPRCGDNPVSSVACAIQAALGELDGDLADLFPTMALVIATVAVVAATYHQPIRRFPEGGGGACGIAAAFGDGWAFVPLPIALGASAVVAGYLYAAWVRRDRPAGVSPRAQAADSEALRS